MDSPGEDKRIDSQADSLLSEIYGHFDHNKGLAENILALLNYLPQLTDTRNSELLWKIYAKCYYSGLKNLIPYIDLQKEIADLVNLQPNENKLVVDLGCGPFPFGRIQKEKMQGNHIIGIDLARAMLTDAKSNFPAGSFVLGDLEKQLPLKEYCADIVISTNVLSFLHDPQKFAADVGRILKPNGQALITTHKQNFDLAQILKAHYYSEVGRAIDPADLDWKTDTPEHFAASCGRAFQTAKNEIQQQIALVALCNLALPREKINYLPDKEKIEQLFLQNGFLSVQVESTYADQYFRILASKSARSDISAIY